MVAPREPFTTTRRPPDKLTVPHIPVPSHTNTPVYYVVDSSHYNRGLRAFHNHIRREHAVEWAKAHADVLKRNLRVVSPPIAEGGGLMMFDEIWQAGHEPRVTRKPRVPGWGEF